MFTGIIEEVGTIHAIRDHGKGKTLEIHARKVLDGTRIGDSISTDGVCLTVTSLTTNRFEVDVMKETVSRSSISGFQRGFRVNLERAMRLSDRIGGHLVTGHIDGTGIIKDRYQEGMAEIFRISTKQPVLRFMVEKGSVAIDGISLTLISVEKDCFTIGMIPHTQQQTTLYNKQKGDEVNIECDLLAKYVDKLIKPEQASGNITMKKLMEEGYL